MKNWLNNLKEKFKSLILENCFYFDGEVREAKSFECSSKKFLPLLIVSRKLCFETIKSYNIVNIKDLQQALKFDVQNVSPFSDFLSFYRVVEKDNGSDVYFWFIQRSLLPDGERLLAVVPESALAFDTAKNNITLAYDSHTYKLFCVEDNAGKFRSHWNPERIDTSIDMQETKIEYQQFIWAGLLSLSKNKFAGLFPFIDTFLKSFFQKLKLKTSLAPLAVLIISVALQSAYLLTMKVRIDRKSEEVAAITSDYLREKDNHDQSFEHASQLIDIKADYLPISNRLHWLEKSLESVGDIEVTHIWNKGELLYMTAKAESATDVLSHFLQNSNFESVNFFQAIRSEGNLKVKQVFTLEISFKGSAE